VPSDYVKYAQVRVNKTAVF